MSVADVDMSCDVNISRELVRRAVYWEKIGKDPSGDRWDQRCYL